MSRREDGTGRRSEEPWAESPGERLSGRDQEGRGGQQRLGTGVYSYWPLLGDLPDATVASWPPNSAERSLTEFGLEGRSVVQPKLGHDGFIIKMAMKAEALQL